MKINVLSLFDGLGCGRIALEREGIKVNNYFASEIDKYAVKVANNNYPDIEQLGDVTNAKGADLPHIDLLIGGSPCQGFSFAGKQLNFDDPRSILFFEFARILKELKPKYFLLENVKMKKEYQDIISAQLGVQPIEINSALVSAQNRKRLYWTNIPGVKQPEDKGILLRDIIENGFVDRNKAYCVDANYYKGGNLKQYYEKARRQLVFGCAMRGRYDQNKKIYQNIEFNGTEKSNSITTVRKDSILFNKQGFRKLTPVECERLQTIPDNYTEGVSNTQRYKMLGNSWTVDVIKHIFKGLHGNLMELKKGGE